VCDRRTYITDWREIDRRHSLTAPSALTNAISHAAAGINLLTSTDALQQQLEALTLYAAALSQ